MVLHYASNLWHRVRAYFGQPLTVAAPAAPQNELRLRLCRPGLARLRPGRYRLVIEIASGIEALGVPLLYASAPGQATTEGNRLKRSIPRRRLLASFIVPAGAASLELVPGAAQGDFVLGRITLRRTSAAEYYLRLAATAVLARHRQGGPMLPLVREALRLLGRAGLAGVAAELRRMGGGAEFREDDYAAWIATTEKLSGRLPALAARLAKLEALPLISVLMPVYNTPLALLQEAIESVENQIYPNWELCVADDGSSRPGVRRVLQAASAGDGRIKLVFRPQNEGIAAATNAALAIAEGQWIALLDHDDRLAPQALAEAALAIDAHPGLLMLYSDEDKISPSGQRTQPYFKPDFSRELFRSQNYLNHFTVYRADAARAIGGWRSAFDGSQDYDFNLRIFEQAGAGGIHHIPQILYHWRTAPGSTARDGSEKSYAFAAGLRALEAHLSRTGETATAEPAPDAPYYRLRPALPAEPPLVSLIIPSKDKPALLRSSIEFIRRKTKYRPYEIIVVDNGSRDPEALLLLAQLATDPAIRILLDDRPFNFSALNNRAVATAKGSIIGLINNDIEVISPDWLGEMVGWAIQPGIGCVGAKLYYADGRVQHAGVILGIGGVAGHSHKYFPRQHPGYFHRLKLLQNLSAVTGACMVVRKQVYQQVGGLNEDDLAIAFNDVDFCLRVRAAGFENVWTPYAELYHLESASRGSEDNPEKIKRFNSEAAYVRECWGLDRDPYYSQHLTREREDFSIALTYSARRA